MIDEILEDVRRQKNFYRDNYRRFLRTLMICLFIIIILLAGILFIVFLKEEPNYYASSSDGMVIRIIPAPWGSRLPAPAQDSMPVEKKEPVQL